MKATVDTSRHDREGRQRRGGGMRDGRKMTGGEEGEEGDSSTGMGKGREPGGDGGGGGSTRGGGGGGEGGGIRATWRRCLASSCW